MKHLLLVAAFVGCLYTPAVLAAWDGFDADSSDLVEVTPDHAPLRGDTVNVRNYDADTKETCLVESITRNTRTVELVIQTPAKIQRTLVMEWR